MRSSHTLTAIETTFDEDNLVANAGLVAPAALAQKLGLAEVIDERVKLPAGAGGAGELRHESAHGDGGDAGRR